MIENIAIVLVRPRFPENIGACCRAMNNMGLDRLIVVSPADFDLRRIEKMAIHSSAHVVEKIAVYDDLETALADFTFIAGTTARMGRQRQMVITPRQFAAEMQTVAPENNTAILFGPEDRGLDNDAIRYCHRLIHIPTSEFASLNLAQAVMVICYELFVAGAHSGKAFSPRFAEHHELEGMYGHLKDALIKIDFINPENPDYWMNNFRRFFARIGLTAKEVRLIRGICRQINWYGEKRYADGLKAAGRGGEE
ncbi:MAG: RNA methyltransferase [Thermodesulfobacteriota bacterium]|nr:RNA methyltransferase [Thermodesulfobacteriota bacterium]